MHAYRLCTTNHFITMTKNHICCITTHTHTQPFYGSLDFVRHNLVSQHQKKHSPTHNHRGHQISLHVSSIYYDPWHPPYSIHTLYSLFPQSLSMFSLVYLLARHSPLHTPHISSPNHYPLFATHAHTIATCFAVILRLCHLIPSLSLNFTWDSIL